MENNPKTSNVSGLDQPSHNSVRRAVLKGMLAAGCALCVPAAWAEEPAPKASPKGGGGKSGKVSKALAKYRDMPNGSQQCSKCNNFTAPNTCKVVEGSVSPSGWCTLFAAKLA